MLDQWINKNYKEIIEWSRNITSHDQQSRELAHYALLTVLESPRREELIRREQNFPNTMKWWIISIMKRQWFSKTGPFHLLERQHRQDWTRQRQEVSPDEFRHAIEGLELEEYNLHQDTLIEAILGMLEEMDLDGDRLWYISRLFKMWIHQPNYSELSRKTGIPRTSISKAVKECKEYILNELIRRNLLD